MTHLHDLQQAATHVVSCGQLVMAVVSLVDLAFGAFLMMMGPLQAFLFLGYFTGASFIFRGFWSVVFASDMHQIEKFGWTSKCLSLPFDRRR